MASNDTTEAQKILADLDKAEESVLRILDTASRTVQELEKIPDCNFELLKELVIYYILRKTIFCD